jgi:hypothetical protein
MGRRGGNRPPILNVFSGHFKFLVQPWQDSYLDEHKSEYLDVHYVTTIILKAKEKCAWWGDR